jgi:voltage-gated sodium channel
MESLFNSCKKIAKSNWFQAFIIMSIMLAGVVVGIQTYESTSARIRSISSILSTLDLVVLIVFTIEVVIKVLAEGKKPWKYFTDSWNLFDFTIVAVCYLAFLVPTIDASFVAVLRLARILRVFKLVTALPQLQVLVGAMLKSIPSMGYVGILLSLLFYIYAVMAVFMFGENDPLHFGTLHKSMLSLFRVVTLEDWTDIMYINMYGCDHPIWGYDALNGCANPAKRPYLAAFFFVSFVLIGTMIVLNLFIGVIMNSMDEVRAEEEENKKLAQLKEGHTSTLADELSTLSEKLELIQNEIKGLQKRV